MYSTIIKTEANMLWFWKSKVNLLSAITESEIMKDKAPNKTHWNEEILVLVNRFIARMHIIIITEA